LRWPPKSLKAEVARALVQALQSAQVGKALRLPVQVAGPIEEGHRGAEVGRHEELLRRPGGIYSRLHELQFSQDPAV